MEVTCLNLVLVRIWKKCHQLWHTRDQRARKWGAIPKIASPMKSMLHIKGGGSRVGSDTFMSNTNCQEIENQCWVG